MVVPPGRPVCRGNGLMKEIEAQIEGLRTSPRARRALQARVWNHLSKRSTRYGHRGHGSRRPLGEASVCSNDSAESFGSKGSVEAGGIEGQPDNYGSWKERSASTSVPRTDTGSPHEGGGGVGPSPPGKAVEPSSVSERVAAQALHAQEVLRRRRCVHMT